MEKQNKTIDEIAEDYTNKLLSYDSTPSNPSETYEWIKKAFIAGRKKDEEEAEVVLEETDNRETFCYCSFSLVDTHSIVTETYEGEFKKCVKDTDEEISSRPFTIQLMYGRYGGEEELLEHQLEKGDFTEEEIEEIIKSLK